MIKINNVEISEAEFNKIAEKQGFIKKSPNKRWRAEEGGEYYSIDTNGLIGSFKECGDNIDNYLHASGNYFKTKEEETAYKNRGLAKQRIIDRLRELEGDWEADWGSIEQRKYWCYYNRQSKYFHVDYSTCFQYQEIELYSTKEAWQQVIKEMPEDIKEMLGVEND